MVEPVAIELPIDPFSHPRPRSARPVDRKSRQIRDHVAGLHSASPCRRTHQRASAALGVASFAQTASLSTVHNAVQRPTSVGSGFRRNRTTVLGRSPKSRNVSA